jgi:hypothetical protein
MPISKEFCEPCCPGYGVCFEAEPSEVSCQSLREAVHGVYKPREVSLTNSTRLGKSLWSLSGMPYTPSSAALLLSLSSAYHPLTSILKRRGGTVKEVKLELTFSRYEVYEEKIREVYRPKCLPTFTTAAREYVRLI